MSDQIKTNYPRSSHPSCIKASVRENMSIVAEASVQLLVVDLLVLGARDILWSAAKARKTLKRQLNNTASIPQNWHDHA